MSLLEGALVHLMAACFLKTRAAFSTICGHSKIEWPGPIDVETHLPVLRHLKPLGHHNVQGLQLDRRSRGLVYKVDWKKRLEKCETAGANPTDWSLVMLRNWTCACLHKTVLFESLIVAVCVSL
jgi:hypothetical protein